MRNPTNTINPLVKIGKSILDGIINAFSFIFPTIADDMNISEASKSVVNSKETSMQYEGYDLSQSDEQSINSFSCPRQTSCHEIYHRTLPHDERAGSPIFDVQRSLRENSV